MTNLCIYCSQAADSIEHPLPAAFGEFESAPLLENRICKKCNNQTLGILDEQLTRCGPEAFFRKVYDVQGRTTHEKINPFERGSAGARRLDARAVDPKLGFEIGFEYQDGAFRQLRQIVFVEESGKVHHLPIRTGMTPVQLLAAYKALGVVAPFDTHIFFDPEEQPWVESLIKATWPSVTVGPGSLSSTNYEGLTVNFQLTERYFRAIAKIGFHYFLTRFPEYRGDEAMFSKLRQYILEGGGGIDRANEFIGKRQNPLLGEMLDPHVRPDGWRGHVLCAEIRPGECLAYVLMFLSEDSPPQVYTIQLANDPSLVDCRAFGHAYIYFKGGARGKYSGEVHVLETTRTDTSPPPPTPVIT